MRVVFVCPLPLVKVQCSSYLVPFFQCCGHKHELHWNREDVLVVLFALNSGRRRKFVSPTMEKRLLWAINIGSSKQKWRIDKSGLICFDIQVILFSYLISIFFSVVVFLYWVSLIIFMCCFSSFASLSSLLQGMSSIQRFQGKYP